MKPRGASVGGVHVLLVLLLAVMLAVMLAPISDALSALKIENIALATDIDRVMDDVDHIGIVRVADTPALAQVRQHITRQFATDSDAWHVEEQAFDSDTPLGVKTFTNIIVTYIPLDQRVASNITSGGAGESSDGAPATSDRTTLGPRVVLAAHYESKFFEEPNHFVGAVDSAVPCAMMIDVARTLLPHMERKRMLSPTLQLVFFDGEEAFVEWTDTDSIYGARELARRWDDQSALSNIPLFLLLDLIGSSNPIIRNSIPATADAFKRFPTIERILKTRGVFPTGGASYFDPVFRDLKMQDDHIPFKNRGVPVIHFIPLPFPEVWHTDEDSIANLNTTAISQLTSLVSVFLADSLKL